MIERYKLHDIDKNLALIYVMKITESLMFFRRELERVERHGAFLLEGRMASKRMFSKTITNSARFLKMPTDSQTLYFHLCMNADDDGVVEAYSVLKITGSNEDNLRVLATKMFIKILNEDLVSHILDWNEHNLIRADRKVDSIYKNLLLQIIPEVEYKNPQPRADTGKITEKHYWTTNGQPMDGIGKVRLGKDSIEEVRKEKKRPSPDEIQTYIDSRGKNYFTGQQFYDKNQTNGWLTGKHRDPIKDWKAVVRTWEAWHESNLKEKQIKKPLQSFRNQNAFNESLKDLNPKEFFAEIEKPKQLENKT